MLNERMRECYIWFYGLNMPPPKCKWWNPTLQCDGIMKWSHWEVIRVRWGQEGRVLINGFGALTRDRREFASSLLPTIWGCNGKSASATQRKTLPHIWPCWHPDLKLQYPHLWEYISVFYTPSSLWYFVTAVQTDADILEMPTH